MGFFKLKKLLRILIYATSFFVITMRYCVLAEVKASGVVFSCVLVRAVAICLFAGVFNILVVLLMVSSLTEYVQIEKQALEEILREVRELKKLATPTPTTITEEVMSSCSAELSVKPK